MEYNSNETYKDRFLKLCSLIKKERQENFLNYPHMPAGMYIGGIRFEKGDKIITDHNGLPRIIKPF